MVVTSFPFSFQIISRNFTTEVENVSRRKLEQWQQLTPGEMCNIWKRKSGDLTFPRATERKICDIFSWRHNKSKQRKWRIIIAVNFPLGVRSICWVHISRDLLRWSFFTFIYHRSSHMNYFMYTFIHAISLLTGGMNSTNWPRVRAQLVEHRTGISRRSRVRIPLKPWFFQASSFQLLKLKNVLRRSFFTFTYHRSSHMNYFTYIDTSKQRVRILIMRCLHM